MKYLNYYRSCKCLECGYQFNWIVRLSDSSNNLSGEASITCPSCLSFKKCSASPAQLIENPTPLLFENEIKRILKIYGQDSGRKHIYRLAQGAKENHHGCKDCFLCYCKRWLKE